MTMTDFRRMAAKMDQHMQQLDVQGVTEPHQVINHMMGYTPELHQIWTGTTDKELMALTQEYPGFYRYALIMETAFEQESQKSSRSYDGMPEFAAAHKHTMEQILTTAATLERGYLAYQGNALTVFDEQIIRLGQSFKLWQECAENFRKGLNADGNVTPMQRDYVHAGLTRISDRLIDLQTKLLKQKK
ncbi:transposase [Serratia liquefaciens]|uniref:Transposase n=1 Tax=Serratia liquefaciens TaxID=614 RepID=A0ABX7DC09_SERLI|nr:transposase [Serratia liquefaciens]